MEPDESLHAVAARQVRAVLHRWDPETSSAATSSGDDLVEPILAALTFMPSAHDLADELSGLLLARLRVRPSSFECLAAARDLIDTHRLLFESVIDAA